MEENKRHYECVKCGCNSFSSDRLQATGGNFAKIFDIQNKRFHTVSCDRCGYTELYKLETDNIMDIFDFMTN